MPIVSRYEFSDLCGDRRDALATYIRRQKVVLVPGDGKMLDTEDPINKDFIEKRQKFNLRKQGKNSFAEKPSEKQELSERKQRGRPLKGHERPKDPADVQKKEKQISEQAQISRIRLDQDMQKKALEIENLELAKQQKMLQLNKAAGELIPVDLMRGVLKRHADSINKSFEKGIETLVIIMTQTLAGGDQKVRTKFIGMAKETLSKSISDAGTMAAEEINILVDEFSQTLSRGQRRG
jgi:hypothetical protein